MSLLHIGVVAGVWVQQPERLLPLSTETTADVMWFASGRVVATRGRRCQLAAIKHFFCKSMKWFQFRMFYFIRSLQLTH